MRVTCFISEFVKTRSTSDVASYLWSSVKCFGIQCREACSENCSVRSLKWARYVWVGNILNTILAHVMGCPYLCIKVWSPKKLSGQCCECGGTCRLCGAQLWPQLDLPLRGRERGSPVLCCSMPWKRIYVLSVKLLKLFQESCWATLCLNVCIHTLPSSIFYHFSF